MLQYLKKLRLYTKLSPETVHKPLISIYTKTYLWSFVDHQYLKKYFFIWNITLNYCSICKIIWGLTLSGNAPGYSSNAHNLTPLFHLLWKIVNDSVPMIMYSDVFFFSEILAHTPVVIPGKILVCGWNLDFLEVNGICI